jgi:transposase
MILELHREGLSVSAIAQRLGLDRKTVRKYIARGLEPPVYGPRQPAPSLLTSFETYLRERVNAYPELTAVRLLREIRELGYAGGYTTLKRFLRMVRPSAPLEFERRFETPPGRQAQVDFAQFRVTFADQPEVTRIVWLFALVLGHSRFLWARFVLHQDRQTLLRCHIAAFTALGGVPGQILYDRMKTAVIGEEPDGNIIYNRALLELAQHYGFQPKACRPYRAKTKGKVERPFRYIRADFFLARTFRDLDDLNAQLQSWLDNVANARRHATTGRVVSKAFADERPSLQLLPTIPFRAVLCLERRISHEGLVAIGGNFYSVPDSTRKRTVEVHSTADEIQIFEDGQLIATHPVLEGRRQTRIAAGHRRPPVATPRHGHCHEAPLIIRTGDIVARRSLKFYEAVGRHLANGTRRR